MIGNCLMKIRFNQTKEVEETERELEDGCFATVVINKKLGEEFGLKGATMFDRYALQVVDIKDGELFFNFCKIENFVEKEED